MRLKNNRLIGAILLIVVGTLHGRRTALLCKALIGVHSMFSVHSFYYDKTILGLFLCIFSILVQVAFQCPGSVFTFFSCNYPCGTS